MDRCERADLHGYAEGLMAAVSEVNVQVIETGWVQRRGGYQRAEQSLSLHRGHALSRIPRDSWARTGIKRHILTLRCTAMARSAYRTSSRPPPSVSTPPTVPDR